MPIVGCKSKFKLFQNFLSDIHDHYEVHSNPFHNFTHGVNGKFILI